MSLNQKYTWADFLKQHPDLKKKGVKRISKEGKKAFEEAFKTYAKTYLKQLTTKLELRAKKASIQRETFVEKLKATKKAPAAKILQAKVGQKDHAIFALTTQLERAKATAKSL